MGLYSFNNTSHPSREAGSFLGQLQSIAAVRPGALTVIQAIACGTSKAGARERAAMGGSGWRADLSAYVPLDPFDSLARRKLGGIDNDVRLVPGRVVAI